ncbi:MAG: hypothetical protein V2I41_16050 [Pseudomonadales bacterium]|jgi:hypothetical protein|nr:hypothetical protein [Pseudomonadales bacterium]
MISKRLNVTFLALLLGGLSLTRYTGEDAIQKLASALSSGQTE